MKKMMSEFKFLVPAVLAISALLGGCKPAEEIKTSKPQYVIEFINICAEVRNCENYGSNQGLVRLLASANGITYRRMGGIAQNNLSKIYDISALIHLGPGVKSCNFFDLRAKIDVLSNEYDWMFFWSAFKLEGLSYLAKDLKGKDIYVDRFNNRVSKVNPETLEILENDSPINISPQGQQGGKISFAHALALQPTLTKVDFSAGRGEVVFDCQNPQGDGNINSQLSKFLLKETIKNKFKSLTNSATASKEVSETRSEKEQEIKESKKESSIAL